MSHIAASLQGRARGLSIDVDLTITEQTLVLVGPNGAGKTTLLLMLLGVIGAARGRIEADGALLYDTERGIDVPVEERRMGYVPQGYALFEHLTVRQNLGFAARSTRDAQARAEREARAEGLLDELDLRPLADRRARALSGGERQRVALARALGLGPRALLLDEPLAALDARARREVRAFLIAYLRRLALPTVVVTHDPDDAAAFAGTVAVLEAGQLVHTGSWESLTERPPTPYARALVARREG